MMAWTAVILLALVGPLASGMASPGAVARVLDDGTELIVVHERGARWTSLRYVFRSGGGADPAEKAGLAHLVEHLVFGGSYEIGGTALAQELRANGAQWNALTSPDATQFILDAPAEKFRAVAERFIHVVTNPALGLVDIQREKGVIATEAIYHSRVGLLSIADARLFASLNLGATLIGTTETREKLAIDDVMSFYANHYVPFNSTVVIVGEMTIDEAQDLFMEACRLPPVAQAEVHESLRPRMTAPLTPLDERVRAPMVATLQGYHAPGIGDVECRDVARAVDFRMHQALMLERQLAESVRAECVHLRGHPFVLGTAFSSTFESGLVPDAMKAAFDRARKQMLTAAEKQVLIARARSERLKGSALADELGWQASKPREAGATTDLRAVVEPLDVDPARLRATAARYFVPSRQVSIHFSPFEG